MWWPLLVAVVRGREWRYAGEVVVNDLEARIGANRAALAR